MLTVDHSQTCERLKCQESQLLPADLQTSDPALGESYESAQVLKESYP